MVLGMKICHLISSHPLAIGGMQSYCYNLASQQAKKGHKVYIYISGNSKNSLIDKSIISRELKPLFSIGKATFPYKLPYELITNKFDIIHIHLPFHFGFEIALIVSKIKKVPLVATYQCLVEDYGNNIFKKIIFKIYNFINKKLLNYVDHIIFTTVDTRRLLQPKNSGNSSIIPVGVNINKFKPGDRNLLRKKYSINKSSFVILFVGNLDVHNFLKKGVPYLLDAIPDIQKTIPRLKVLFIGKTDQKVNAIISEFHRKNNTSGIVDFLGNVNNSDLPEYYALSNLLILPSVSRLEAFGTVLIEALSCGIPVLASDIAGVRTVIRSTNAGFLVKQRSSRDIAEKVISIYNNRNDFQKIARTSAIKQYSWPKITGQINNIYQNTQ